MHGQTSDVQRPLEIHQNSQDSTAVTAATTLTASQLVVYVTTPASSSYAVTLPAAHLCGGRFCTVYATNTGGGEVSLASNAGDLVALSVGDNLSAAGDYVVLYCNGLFWVVVAEVTT